MAMEEGGAFTNPWYKEFFGMDRTDDPATRGVGGEDDDPDKKLKAHTPTPDYMRNIMLRRALQHLGAGKSAKLIAPEPYKSEYPTSNKMLDAMLALSIDPIIKPASLKGKLGEMPALEKLANELANKGYFRRYPGGGIGIGSGGGGSSDAAASTGDDPGLNLGSQPAPLAH